MAEPDEPEQSKTIALRSINGRTPLTTLPHPPPFPPPTSDAAMARTTRSAVSHADKTEDENQNPSSASPPASTKAKSVNKKRKRGLGADSDDLPSAKLTKGDEEDAVDRGEDERAHESEYPPLVGELPMADEDAQKILDILEL